MISEKDGGGNLLKLPSLQKLESNELFNSISHLVGLALSIAGLAVLVAITAVSRKPIHIVASAIYGATMCVLYFSSAAYHFTLWLGRPRIAAVMQKLDHCAIYLLIAGSYTPICLIILKGGWRWSMFGVVWGLAITGIVLKIFVKDPKHAVSFTFYIVMGWLAMIAIVPIARVLDAGGLALLIAGGVSYTVGAIFLATKFPRLVPGVFGHHEVWHIFVLVGSVCHFFMTLGAVV